MSLQDWMRPVHVLNARRRRVESSSRLLSPAAFDHAAACERMRTDRNHSPLSILLITLPNEASRGEDVRFLSRVLAGRLRMTDTAGRLRDGRIAVLLPDTTEAGAWKVAEDVCEVYEVGQARPSCEVMVYPDHRSSDHGTRAPNEHERQPTAAAVGGPRPVPAAESFFVRSAPPWKRLIDIVGASIGLVLASPVICAAAAAVVTTSRGAPFYVQEREGMGGRRFHIYKIRTMKLGSDRIKDNLRKHSEQDGPAFKMTNDPRVTRVGAFLRRTSIDELPQLLNVLQGHMSLVGPRPLQLDESLACQPWQRQRLSVKPGLTCIWQVKGRSVVTFDEWIRMDLQYAKQVNLLTDLKLIAQTPPALVTSNGPR